MRWTESVGGRVTEVMEYSGVISSGDKDDDVVGVLGGEGNL